MSLNALAVACVPMSSWSNLEDEFVAADADGIAIGEGGAESHSTTLNVHAVGRGQIVDDETASGIDDHGVTLADLGVVKNDVAFCHAPYPTDCLLKGVVPSRSVAQPSDNRLAAKFGVSSGGGAGSGLGGSLGVQRGETAALSPLPHTRDPALTIGCVKGGEGLWPLFPGVWASQD